jgi:spermidine/putrescine transport system ATP-binding protein/putrescine transport system ATP-binding protein
MAMIETEGLGNIPVPTDQLTHPDGAPVQVALRPEKFALSATRPEGENAVEGRLNTAAYLGERSHYYISIPGRQDPVAVSSPNLRRMNLAGPGQQTGAPMWLSWSPDSVVILDREPE